MTLSMTGFGKAEVQTQNLFINIEIRSLNSKFLDLSLKTPSIFKELDLPIRSILKKEIKRGKIELMLHYEKNSEENNLSFNHSQISKYYQQLKKIREDLNDNSETDLISQILQFPDIFNSEKNYLEENEQELILDGIRNACKSLNVYRQKEGESLSKVIIDYVKNSKFKLVTNLLVK